MIYTEHFIYNLINGKEFSLEKLMFIHMICSINISIEQNKIDEFNLKPPDIFKQVVNDTISSLFEKIENKNYKNFHNGENFLFLRGYKNIYEISQLPVLNKNGLKISMYKNKEFGKFRFMIIPEDNKFGYLQHRDRKNFGFYALCSYEISNNNFKLLPYCDNISLLIGDNNKNYLYHPNLKIQDFDTTEEYDFLNTKIGQYYYKQLQYFNSIFKPNMI